MDSLEYMELRTGFGKGLRRIADDIDAAAEGTMAQDEAVPAVAKAREKVAEYEKIFARLQADSPTLAAQFAKAFEDDIGGIRDCLAKLKKSS